MKKSISILTAILAFVISSCSKDDEKPNPNASTQVFENNVPVNIPDYDSNTQRPGNIGSLINVTAIGTLVDVSKVTLELKLKHSHARDIAAVLILPGVGARYGRFSPNATAYDNCFIFRVGLSEEYLETNLLRFNSTFTNVLNPVNGFMPSGNYKESKRSDDTQMLNPLFQNLQGVSVNGNWTLFLYDFGVDDIGSIVSWKLIFEPGAIK